MAIQNAWKTLAVVILAVGMASASPAVRRSDKAVRVDLGNGTVLHFALADGMLLGLRSASVDGVPLTSDDTVLRPVLAQEWASDRVAIPLMRFSDAKVVDGKVQISCELLGTGDLRAYRALFVFAANRDKALSEGMTPALKALQAKADAASVKIAQAVQNCPEYKQALAERKRLEEAVSKESNRSRKKKLQGQLRNLSNKKLPRLRKDLRPKLVASSAALKAAQADIDAFEDALLPVALEFGQIHRDYYRFAIPRLPADVCRMDAVRQLARDLAGTLKPVGTLTWTVEPVQRNIAGWQWTGWRQSFSGRLANGRKINVLRQLGTWEIGGTAKDLTVAALRYRGLGNVEQKLSTDADGRVNEAWNTTEILPGAAGQAMAISPAVPSSSKVNDRGYALSHRVGAWIAQPARGAGAPFVDFQFRPQAALCSYREKQGNFRAKTEVYPGDRAVSQIDEEWFPLSNSFQTQPQLYLALVTGKTPLALHESRNRWREVDQYVRDLVSDELRFRQFEPLPGIGLLFDNGWAWSFKSMANGGVARWAGKGVKLIVVHNPGWINGRYQGPGGPPKTLGGVCSIYDWVPTNDMKEPWKAFSKACAKGDVAYYPWVGQTQIWDAPFARRVGLDRKHWSLNAPGDKCGPGYAPDNLKGNIFDAKFRKEFLGTLADDWKQYGYQGFWCDSFQNLFMSQLNWTGDANSMQRAWWEVIAGWTRKGIGWMAESHSFPGMSCSIEVHGWEDQPWYFQHVWRWYRGLEQRHYTREQLERQCFRFMACKAWTAPDVRPGGDPNAVIPNFTRFAKEYAAALPDMRRSYILDGDRGMLWLPYSSDDEGVLFAFGQQSVPAGVTARNILDNAPATTFAPQTTYRVKGNGLTKLFGVRTGPLADPRKGRKYRTPEYVWPVK